MLILWMRLAQICLADPPCDPPIADMTPSQIVFAAHSVSPSSSEAHSTPHLPTTSSETTASSPADCETHTPTASLQTSAHIVSLPSHLPAPAPHLHNQLHVHSGKHREAHNKPLASNAACHGIDHHSQQVLATLVTAVCALAQDVCQQLWLSIHLCR